MKRRWVFCFFVLLGFIGCGGGGSPPTASAPPPVTPVTSTTPSIIAITPSVVTAGSNDTIITVTGSGFVSSSVVQLNSHALATVFNSATTLQATLPGADLANGSVATITVANPATAGGVSSSTAFTINNPQPAVSGIDPATIPAGSPGLTLTITGSGFVPSSVVAWGGTPLATTFVNATTLHAALPADATAGSVAAMVTVTNGAPGGGSSGQTPVAVTSPVPSIGSISPSSVPAGAAATITVNGNGFENNSAVLWNGVAHPTVAVSNSVLQVMLSAKDLATVGTGSLAVANPDPGAATSGSIQLTVTLPPPAITSVSIQNSTSGGPGGYLDCKPLQITVTGTNFTSVSTIKVNGAALPGVFYGGDVSSISNSLPIGLVSAPGALTVTVTNPSGAASAPFSYPASAPPVLAICPMPEEPAVLPGSNFSVTVVPSEVNAPGGEQLTVGPLPSGLTINSSTVPLPQAGAPLHFQASSSLASGTYQIALTGIAGSAKGTSSLPISVSSSPVPGIFLSVPPAAKLGVVIGGSNSIQFTIASNQPNADFDITPSVSGLPPGTSAAFSPAVLELGQTATLTITASASAPVSQNVAVTITATPPAPVSAASAKFLLDVTHSPGSLPGNRTTFTSTAGEPFAAVYDAAHDLIFASNPSWNRVDVLSNKTHQVIKSIPVLSPQGLDITQDNSTVWVGTLSQRVLAIDTAHLTAATYLLPKLDNARWQDRQVVALGDGTVLFLNADATVGLWTPATNNLQSLKAPSGAQTPFWGPFRRSGDGSKAYSINVNSANCQILVYDTATKSTTPLRLLDEVCGFYAVNQDGSRLVVGETTPVGLYDSSLNLLGTLFAGPAADTGYFEGAFLFSHDGSTLYEISNSVISTIDTASLQVLGTAPSISVSSFEGRYDNLSGPFAVDSSGMILELQNYGIAFDDSTAFQSYGTFVPPDIYDQPLLLSPNSGTLGGGTQLQGIVSLGLTPDVWFGDQRGTVTLSGTTLEVKTPPSATAGPVNLKYLFPDGTEYFTPLGFSYSANPEYAVTSGASPDGGVPATVAGFGLPVDANSGSITVGGNGATITSTKAQSTGEPFPDVDLNYTVPPGASGPADITVTTLAGTGTLSRGMYYAKSVTDYPSADAFTAVLFDAARSQVYLAAGDHVDVFSTASNRYVSSLAPAAVGKVKQFAGLGLTPDNGQLLVPDLADGSLAVINPDVPTNSYAIPIAPAYQEINGCPAGPLYVAASADGKAFVTTGGIPALSCGVGGGLYIADLASKLVTTPTIAPCQIFPILPYLSGSSSPDASTDGNFVMAGACLYSAQAASYVQLPLGGSNASIAGDADVVASTTLLSDISGNLLGQWATPTILYPSQIPLTPAQEPLYRPRLNSSGSLFYVAYPQTVEIRDVLHGRLLMRFALNETVQNMPSPMAIDAGGRHVYLITDKGLTVIDLGEAPLAVGRVSQTTVSVGSRITLRGSGFDSTVTATIGGHAAALNVTDENTLTLIVPAAPSGPEDIVLERADGSSYTVENAVTLP